MAMSLDLENLDESKKQGLQHLSKLLDESCDKKHGPRLMRVLSERQKRSLKILDLNERWLKVADRILKGNPDRQYHESNLMLHDHGNNGANPGYIFLGVLEKEQPDLTLLKFMEIARKFERLDVEALLCKLAEEKKKVKDLTESDKKYLAALLNEKGIAIKNWIYFAEEILPKPAIIEILVSERNIRNSEQRSEGPTMALLNLLKEIMPNLNTDDFVKYLTEINCQGSFRNALTSCINFLNTIKHPDYW